MNQASRWRAFISWWNNYIPQQGEDVYEVVTKKVGEIKGGVMRGLIYRTVMKIAHKFHWHYAPPCYPDGDTMLWCKWCGMRDVVKKVSKKVSLDQLRMESMPCDNGTDGRVDQ